MIAVHPEPGKDICLVKKHGYYITPPVLKGRGKKT